MKKTRRATLALVGIGLAGPITSLLAQASPSGLADKMRNACQGRASCSEADFYSGTLDRKEELTSDIKSGDARSTSNLLVTVHVVVTSGKVECVGQYTLEEKAWTAGKITVDSKASGKINGPGLIHMTFEQGGSHSVMGATENEDVELDPNQLSYNVAVTCPSPAVTRTGGGQTSFTDSEPARWGSSQEFQTDHWPGALTQASLSGSSTYYHPDADPINGVGGKVSVLWSLNKAASPKP